MEQEYTEEQIEEASKFTQEELDFINDTTYKVFMEVDVRPIVIIALCSSIVGNLISTSEGILNKETIIDLVDKGVEIV